MANKLTKKDYYARLISLVEESDSANKSELLNFINHEVELLTKKSTNTKPTARQRANNEIKNEIVSALKILNRGVTVSELLTSCPNINDLVEGVPQRASALLTQLSDPKYGDCRVERYVEKKKAYFKVA